MFQGWMVPLVSPRLNFQAIQADVSLQGKALRQSSIEGEEFTCLVFATGQEMMAACF